MLASKQLSVSALIVVFLGISFANAALRGSYFYELGPLWSSWKTLHQKEYSSGEEDSRFAIFVQNYQKIAEFNANSGSHPTALKLALNKFADITPEEFKSRHTGGYAAVASSRLYKATPSSTVDYSLLQLPSSIDWRQKGAVTPVKNQQQCGSCWTFSTTGALESLYFLNHGKLLTFSEQQIVDCDTKDDGCNGGLPEQAFQYTAEAGLETEADYPYTSADGKCQYDSSKAIKVNSGHRVITAKSVSALKAALAVQPVSIGIEADQSVFQFYKSGVIKGSAGCGDNLDHAVLAVGYTTLEGEEAFIVKNSWGADWGNDGYVYLSTEGDVNGGSGVCGILGDPVVPTA